MPKNNLDKCEYLFQEKERYLRTLFSDYTKYMCAIDGERCLYAIVKPLKFWRMADDLYLEKVRECPKREQFSEKFTGYD